MLYIIVCVGGRSSYSTQKPLQLGGLEASRGGGPTWGQVWIGCQMMANSGTVYFTGTRRSGGEHEYLLNSHF